MFGERSVFFCDIPPSSLCVLGHPGIVHEPPGKDPVLSSGILGFPGLGGWDKDIANVGLGKPLQGGFT